MKIDISILESIVDYFLVAIIFLVTLAIAFRITLKNYNVKSSKIKFYGLFLGMNNRSILAFSLITLNYIFLIWCTGNFTGINIVYFGIMLLFMVGSSIVMKDYRKIPMDMIFCMINALCIYVTNMIYGYLMNEYTTIFLLIVLGLVIIFIFLYFTYITFKYLNNIVLKQEQLKKKNYTKI